MSRPRVWIAVHLALAGCCWLNHSFAAETPAPPRIDRQALVTRHNVELTGNSSGPVQVGNGEFAFSADCTGLQTFENLCTMSQWGWGSSPLPPGARVEDFQYTPTPNLDGRMVPLPLDRGDALTRWLAGNPHRINLGRLGLRLLRADGSLGTSGDISNARQSLDLWHGVLTSRFEFAGQPVEVQTCCHPEKDQLAVRIRSPLLAQRRLRVELAFPYPDLNLSGGFGEMKNADAHRTSCRPRGDRRADFQHTIDAANYHVALTWTGGGSVAELARGNAAKSPVLAITSAEFGAGDSRTNVLPQIKAAVRENRISVRASNDLVRGIDPAPGQPKILSVHYTLDGAPHDAEVREGEFFSIPDESDRHRYVLSPKSAATGEVDTFEFICAFSPQPLPTALPTAAETFAACSAHWPAFWQSGGAIDLSGSHDPRWRELERRIVLSQYLCAVNTAGSLPPAESGLAGNSWYGRFHWEMYWWHGAHYALWDRWPLLRRSLGIYARLLPAARTLAKLQGYRGARWPKCTGPDGREWPSTIDATLIWQQPHPILFAELDYRAHPTRETLERWREIVSETADFLASFPTLDKATDQRVLGPPLTAVSENTPTGETRNPTFELAYWRLGLGIAQNWRQRLGLPREPAWDATLRMLAPLPVQEGRYVLYEGIAEMWTKWNFEHPALVGAYGWLPPGEDDAVDAATMRRTLEQVRATWRFDRMWGWDFPVLAMCAARLGEPPAAIDFLLRPEFAFSPTGTSGGPPPYFPTNGALLYAAAFLAAGWDGAPARFAPGFPDDGSWTVRAEGLQPAP